MADLHLPLPDLLVLSCEGLLLYLQLPLQLGLQQSVPLHVHLRHWLPDISNLLCQQPSSRLILMLLLSSVTEIKVQLHLLFCYKVRPSYFYKFKVRKHLYHMTKHVQKWYRY